jgi:uncharacterized protein (TIGR02594 family)
MAMKPWYGKALTQIGVKEVAGDGSNPTVEAYHAATSIGASDDSVPWCASFVNWCLKEADTPGTGSPAARSFMKWGKGISKPVEGCICVFSMGDPNGWKGHVGFYVEEDDTHISVLGGNQSDEVNISRYSKDKLLGYRLPKVQTDSTTVKASIGGAAASAGGILVAAQEIAGHVKGLFGTVSETQVSTAWVVVMVLAFIGIAAFGWVYRERIKKLRETGT